MKKMQWRGRKCVLVNDVGKIIIAEGRIVMCDLKEIVLNDDLGETDVRVTILSYQNERSQIMLM
jgi:hypothetical protein